MVRKRSLVGLSYQIKTTPMQCNRNGNLIISDLKKFFFSSRLYILCRLDLKGNLVFTPFQDEHSQLFHELSYRTQGADEFLWRQIHSIEIVILIWPFQFHLRAPNEAFDKVFYSTKEKCFTILFLRILQSLSESPRSRQSIPWVEFFTPTQTTYPPPSNYITAPLIGNGSKFLSPIIIIISPPKVHIHAIIIFSTIKFSFVPMLILKPSQTSNKFTFVVA